MSNERANRSKINIFPIQINPTFQTRAHRHLPKSIRTTPRITANTHHCPEFKFDNRFRKFKNQSLQRPSDGIQMESSLDRVWFRWGHSTVLRDMERVPSLVESVFGGARGGGAGHLTCARALTLYIPYTRGFMQELALANRNRPFCMLRFTF